jgi:hypothetical protein
MAIRRPATAAGIGLFRAWINDGTARPAGRPRTLLAMRATPAARNRIKASLRRVPSEGYSFDRLAGTSAYLLARAAPDAQVR